MAPPRSLPDRTSENPRRFRFHRCLGRGGFGEVYRATMWRDGGVSTEVAVKVLATDLDPSSDAVRRLTDEGRLLGALNHPGIVKVYDLVLLAGRVALVTEYIEGQDLHAVLTAGPSDPFPRRGLVETVGRVAEALHAAWTTPSPTGGGAMHLVHRDVKPQNIRLGIHGEVKLIDFGIARAANVERESRTQTNLMMGSWPYLAPERLVDEESEPGPEIDVYGLGCTLYEGLGGQRLLEGYKLLDLYRFVEEEGGLQSIVDARLAELTARAPPAILKLLARMLSSDPVERPPPYELAQRCEDLAERMPGANLRRWARDRQWPDPQTSDGPLTDMDLTEGTLEVPKRKPRGSGSPSASAPPAAPRSTVPPASSRVTAPPPPLRAEGLRTVVPRDLVPPIEALVELTDSGAADEPTVGDLPPLHANLVAEPTLETTESVYDEPTDRQYGPIVTPLPPETRRRTPPIAAPPSGPRTPAPASTRSATPAPAPARDPKSRTPGPYPTASDGRSTGAGPTELRPREGHREMPATVIRGHEREDRKRTPTLPPLRDEPASVIIHRSERSRDDSSIETPPTARPRSASGIPSRSEGDEPRLPDVAGAVNDEPALPDLLAIKIDEPGADEVPRRAGRSAAFRVGVALVALALPVLAAGVVALAVVGVYWLQGGPADVPTPTPLPVPLEQPLPAPPEPDVAVAAPDPQPSGVAPAAPEPEPAAPEPAEPEPEPEPAQPEPAQPEPAVAAPDPAPARPVPVIVIEEEPAQPEPAQPEPAQPEPEAAEPEPAAAAPAPTAPQPDTPARLVVEGDAVVELQGDFGGFRAGTPLPPGGYSVWADFGEGLVNTEVRTIALPGDVVRVNCSVSRKECLVTP